MKKIFIYVLLFSCMTFANNTILVTVSPSKFFVQKIVKNAMKVKVLFPDAKFEKKYRKLELIHLSKSKVYFTLGLEKEKKYKELLLEYNPKLDIYDLSQNVKKLKNKKDELNPYIWMDPLRVRIIAINILKKVIKIDPKNTKFYLKNYIKFTKDIDKMFLSIKKKYYTSSDSIFILDNDWLYYIDTFKLDSYALEQRILDANEIQAFRHKAALNQTKTVLVKKGFDYVIARSISTSSNDSKIVENNVYAYNWKQNIIQLTNSILGISKKAQKEAQDKINLEEQKERIRKKLNKKRQI